ncbi:MAG TPA: pyridoxal-dependent decarboxylase, partial [Flavisolibacter sp.]|nr:pyridoxal-dependent decarboxylase [Flavisolibacter sp.]
MKNLQELEQQARALDPDHEQRLPVWNQVLAYANQFLNELPATPGFSNGSFEKLGSLRIEEAGKPIETLLEVLKTEVDRTGINSASGKHMGFIPGGGLWASALADMLSDITNKYSGIAFSGPGAVKVESQVIRWLTSVIGYPAQAFGNLTSGGSIANLTAIKAARDAHGINSTNVRQAVIYFGEQTHHSVYKALHTTGLHEAVQRKIALTARFQINTLELAQQMAADTAAGLQPFLVVGSAGTTDTGAVDPLDELATLCQQYNAWFHVDAAYGGFFMLVEEMKAKLKGIERSHSVVLDPHKTLFLPFGSGAVLLRDGNVLLASNSAKASYLIDTDEADDISPADTGIELTRPNRGLRMWLPLQLHGVAPFRACLEEKLVLIRYFYEQIQKLGFETGPYPELTVVVFRYPGDVDNTINQQLITAIHADGRVFLSSTVIEGKVWLRCAIVSHRTHLTEVNLA